jgi:hypothetical protein
MNAIGINPVSAPSQPALAIPFEPTGKFCYHFGRYTVIPEIQEMPETSGELSFRLTDLAQKVIDKYLTPEQQSIKVKKAQSDKTDYLHSLIKFYVSLLVREREIFVRLGDGVFRSKTVADISDVELEEAALADGDEGTDEFEGWIYAFSFPTLVVQGAPFPIKIGKTIKDLEERVSQQCKGSAMFENPVILGRWQVRRVGPTESAAPNVLKARGKWRENAPGKEWFDTTITEIQQIIDFINSAN